MPPSSTDTATATPTTDEALAALEHDFLDRMNTSFDDALLFVGRVLGDRPAATAAQAVGLDAGGLDLALRSPTGDETVRVAFLEAVTDPMAVSLAAFALVGRARELAPDAPLTSIERNAAEMSSIRTFITEVRSATDIHPHLRQITFGGGDLTTFTPLGPDTFLYVLLPPPGRTELTIDQSFTWEQHRNMAPEDQPVGAYYTLRAWRPEQAELDMLFVLHDDPGPASAWAERAAPGDPVALWGPREGFEPPADTDWYLLCADETGLPAAARIIESLPAGTPAHVFAEVADETARQELPTSPDVHVTWLHRGDEPADRTATLLADAVRALPWPGGTPYVWGGGESHAMTAVRRYVRTEVGLDRANVSLVAYWRNASLSTTADDHD